MFLNERSERGTPLQLIGGKDARFQLAAPEAVESNRTRSDGSGNIQAYYIANISNKQRKSRCDHVHSQNQQLPGADLAATQNCRILASYIGPVGK